MAVFATMGALGDFEDAKDALASGVAVATGGTLVKLATDTLTRADTDVHTGGDGVPAPSSGGGSDTSVAGGLVHSLLATPDMLFWLAVLAAGATTVAIVYLNHKKGRRRSRRRR